jgi:hypothetical protein
LPFSPFPAAQGHARQPAGTLAIHLFLRAISQSHSVLRKTTIALEKWAQRLNSIVSPPAKLPDKKIVPLQKRRR